MAPLPTSATKNRSLFSALGEQQEIYEVLRKPAAKSVGQDRRDQRNSPDDEAKVRLLTQHARYAQSKARVV